MSDLLEALKRVVLENTDKIGCPSHYGLKNDCPDIDRIMTPVAHFYCWQAAITQEGGEADA